MCKVKWCDEESLKYSNNKPKFYCKKHSTYKQYVSNAPSRPWLMYKFERILENKLECENCGFNPIKHYPNENIRILSSMMDVDHKDPSIKGKDEGEQPSNYQLLCKHCHILKSHREGDYTNKKNRIIK
jgi:5-methylcytosine-specific restriction endonuclease McrA